MTTTFGERGRRPMAERGPGAPPVLNPQSTGADGLERLRAAWARPRRLNPHSTGPAKAPITMQACCWMSAGLAGAPCWRT